MYDSMYVSDDIWVHTDMLINHGWTDGKEQRMVKMPFKDYAKARHTRHQHVSWYVKQKGKRIRL